MSASKTPITIAVSAELLFKRREMIPGYVSSFIKALNAANAKVKEHYPESGEAFKVILLNSSSFQSDELITAIQSHKMENLITLCPVEEENLINKLKSHQTHLYLSAQPGKMIQEAVNEDIAAAIVFTPERVLQEPEMPLRFVFDGDGVLFSNQSEQVFKEKGLAAYLEHEREHVDQPMTRGPFTGFLEALGQLQKKFYDNDKRSDCPIQTYLLTARDAGSAGHRALNTLKIWGLQIDQAYFLNGSPKKPLLEMIKAHIFFDDQERHVEKAVEVGILAGHVPHCKE